MLFSQVHLKRNLKKDFSPFREVKIAVLGDFSTQIFCQLLKGYGYELALNFNIYEAEFSQIDLQVFQSDSELYHFSPDVVIVGYTSEKLKEAFYGSDPSSRSDFSEKQATHLEAVYNQLKQNGLSKVLFFNFSEVDDRIFGNFSNKASESFLFQIRSLNVALMHLAQRYNDLFITDIALLTSELGYKFMFDPRFYYSSEMVFSVDGLCHVVKQVGDSLKAQLGKIAKCLILDLDNTLWGGIIGDDGIQNIQIGHLSGGMAFTAVQQWAKELKNRGILLAVCSKNEEINAKEPFTSHPDMVLTLDDFVLFYANWKNKVDNIKSIQTVLNIGFDSMVFIDDNPFERNMVRESLPDVVVPELPEDPSEYLRFLIEQNLFETASSSSEEDKVRTEKYKEEAKRKVFEESFTSSESFLESLGMVAIAEPFDAFHIPRVAQLTQRSNQFNLRTVRYSDDQVASLASNPAFVTRYFCLEDKFGNHGLIGLFILEKKSDTLFVDTLIMSCRVLKRGMEAFIFEEMVAIASQVRSAKIVGEYLSTVKNGLVKDLYRDFGFKPVSETQWELQISDYQKTPHFIRRNTHV